MKKRYICAAVMMMGIFTACADMKNSPAAYELKWGYIDTAGNYVIEPQFDGADDFENGLAAVAVSNGNDRLWGYIDQTGGYIIEPGFYDCSGFSENGLAAVSIYDTSGAESEEKWGFIDKAGEYVIKPQYHYASAFSEELAAVSIDKDGKELWGYIDSSGEFVIKPQFDDALNFTSNGLAAVRTGGEYGVGKYGYIDRTGAFVIEPRFYQAGNFDKNGLADVIIGDDESGTCIVIDETGNEKKESFIRIVENYDAAGYAVKEENNRYGYTDTSGKFVIEPQFEYAGRFQENGLAAVEARKEK